jgi:hypothetical protein
MQKEQLRVEVADATNAAGALYQSSTVEVDVEVGALEAIPAR